LRLGSGGSSDGAGHLLIGRGNLTFLKDHQLCLK
jgi:hypothetical protein